ncbi:hypothetical protein JHK85_045055 [Glycine max]|nr:hypothetical protein JHK85_045055 [Glycine max]
MRYGGGRKRRMLLQPFLVLCATVTGLGLFMLALRPLDPPITVDFPKKIELGDSNSSSLNGGGEKPCAAVEEMGKDFEAGASRIRDLPPEQFCSHGFVLGKTAEAGFGNEMYKVLTAAALSIMLNRFQGTTDAVAAQFFLKNIHSQMRIAAFDLFGDPQVLGSQPNVFGELLRVLISPSKDVEAAVNWVIGGEENPDISLHMRMLMNRSIRAVQAALHCIKKVIESQHLTSRPKVVVVSDTPSLVKSIMPNISEFAQVLYFDYEKFKGNIFEGLPKLDFRVKDWGPAPRWVAFVDFFLASRAKYAVVSGAHRRVGTTYAQLIAALAATRNLGDNSSSSSFSFLSSFQSTMLTEGLKNQVGWGHVWNRYAGPLSCHNQTNQCAFTPLLPPGWWDGLWQSPIPKDISRLAAYGIKLSGLGTVDYDSLQNYCSTRKNVERTVTFNL